MTTFNIDNTKKTKHLEVLESLEEQAHALQAIHNPQTWRLSALTFALHLHDCYVLFNTLKQSWAIKLPFSEAWDVDFSEWKNRIWSLVNNVSSFTENENYTEWQRLCEKDYHTFIVKANNCLGGELPLKDLLEYLSERNTGLKKVIIDSGQDLSELLSQTETMLYESNSSLYELFYEDLVTIYLSEADCPYMVDENGSSVPYDRWKASKSRKRLPDLLLSKIKMASTSMHDIKFWQDTWDDCFDLEGRDIDKEGFARFIFQNRKKIIENKQYPCKNCLDKCFATLCLCEHLWDEHNRLTITEENESLRDRIIPDIKVLNDIVVDEYKEKHAQFWNQVFENADILRLLKEKNPNTFKGGYNQKLICNIVGKLSEREIYTQSRNDIDKKLYPEKTVYKYLSELSVDSGNTSCAMTEKIAKIIEEILKKTFVKNT